MPYESQSLRRQLLFPLQAALRDAQGCLRMKIDAERIEAANGAQVSPFAGSVAVQTVDGPLAPKRHVWKQGQESATLPARQMGSGQDEPPTLTQGTRITSVSSPLLAAQNSAMPPVERAPTDAIDSSSLQTQPKTTVTASSSLVTPGAHEPNSVFSTAPSPVAAERHSAAIPLALAPHAAPVDSSALQTQPKSATSTAPIATGHMPSPSSLATPGAQELPQSVENPASSKASNTTGTAFNSTAIPVESTPTTVSTAVDHHTSAATLSAVQGQSKTLPSVAPATGRDTFVIGESASARAQTPPVAVSESNDEASADLHSDAIGMAFLVGAPVTVPLRPEVEPASATPPTPAAQNLPNTMTRRFTSAVEPALQQAYQLTQSPLQAASEGAPSSGESRLVNNTFNVSVAMSSDGQTNGLDLGAFEQALTDVLRTAARRHGLEL